MLVSGTETRDHREQATLTKRLTFPTTLACICWALHRMGTQRLPKAIRPLWMSLGYMLFFIPFGCFVFESIAHFFRNGPRILVSMKRLILGELKDHSKQSSLLGYPWKVRAFSWYIRGT